MTMRILDHVPVTKQPCVNHRLHKAARCAIYALWIAPAACAVWLWVR